MTEGTLWSWLTLFFLGAFHGINPGMGWLFAVALGMQERSRRAVWRALLPLGLGHALAVGVVILLAVLVGVMVPLPSLRIPVALILVGMGCHRLFRRCHPRWGGMRVGMAGLTTWSFLMASVHGAGLMVLPVFLNMSAKVQAANCHAAQANAISGPTEGLLATLVHGIGLPDDHRAGCLDCLREAGAWLVAKSLVQPRSRLGRRAAAHRRADAADLGV